MKISISGFKEEGTWEDIVKHGEKITRHLSELDVDQELLQEWKDWMPEEVDDIDDDLVERTAEQASMEDGEGEEKGKEPKDDIKEAGKRLANSSKGVADADTDSAKEELEKAAKHTTRAVDSAGRKTVRHIEETVYKNIMAKSGPLYFDNKLVSANLKKKGKFAEGEEVFVLEININEDDLFNKIEERVSSETED